jgi:hypothetical protein
VGDISGLSGIEVLIGLSFMFFLLSTACSAVQEVLAGVFGKPVPGVDSPPPAASAGAG